MIDMTPNLVLVLTGGVLVGTGVYLLLERSLSRVILGIIMLGNGVNVLFLVAGGRAGGPPLVGTTPNEEMADPLVQAMVLTAIVITLGLSSFVLAMAYRSWQLHGHDEVQDDLEDRRVADRLRREETDTRTDEGGTLDSEAAEARDETEEADAHGPGTSDGTEQYEPAKGVPATDPVIDPEESEPVEPIDRDSVHAPDPDPDTQTEGGDR